MITLSVNAAALGPVLIVLVLSGVLGVALSLLGSLASGVGQLAFGIAEVVAGGGSRPSYHAPQPNKGAVFVRALLYVALCVAAFVLPSSGYVALSYLCAVAGGIALPIAVLKLLK